MKQRMAKTRTKKKMRTLKQKEGTVRSRKEKKTRRTLRKVMAKKRS